MSFIRLVSATRLPLHRVTPSWTAVTDWDQRQRHNYQSIRPCLCSYSNSSHPANDKPKSRRSRQREQAFQVKLGYALLKQGGVNLLGRAKKGAEKGANEFEETKKKVQEQVEKSKIKVKELRENIFTIPNLLTTMRLALSPYIGYLVVNEQYLLGSSLFVLAGVSDLLDGWIARNFENQQSVLGSIIDPLADKCLISILTISLTYSDLIPLPLTALIILRDVGLMSAAFYLRYQSLPQPITLRRYFDVTHATVQMKPTFISKVNTAVQLSLVGFTLIAPVFSFIDHPFLHGLWYVTASTTVLSGLSYCFSRDVFKYLNRNR
ncbi:probable cardiolipin synthase (CMP-forming) isoform X1 [Strongylocentrotus purpuratus]|uniref:cardiolipin synthase (CMP-forming) n=1 Tax=Strongylocentrotus purpuratus TaxID=7668 RepID=A0A7M7PTR6_STRPU|nr:probable cardiolipin synthase (CMP-forming) isoform X1 [Strongylocentrotus purpuratus]|eukprot:XP_792193.3 PREDICTED: probable cardiolipin synthase (CMP-forming) [Strongylocentrotus purpuratus]